jgi:hypothetical protein
MTRDDDFIGQLEGYLDEYEGLTPLPDAVRDAVRAQLPTTKQIGPFSGPMRYVSMITSIPASARYGLVAAVVVAAAALGATMLGSKSGAPSNPTPTPTPLPLAAPWALPAAGPLQAGRFVCARPLSDPLIPSCDLGGPSDYRTISFTVPDGWATADGLFFKHRGEASEVALSFWVPDTIYADPCHWQASGVSDRPLPPLSGVLQRQPGRVTSPLTAVSSFDAGYRTSRLELTVPAELDISTCDVGQYRSWTEIWASQQGVGPERVKLDSAGQVDVLYLVDADRGGLVIDASHMPAASPADLSELEAIVASIKID